jgi:hypothetical protein
LTYLGALPWNRQNPGQGPVFTEIREAAKCGKDLLRNQVLPAVIEEGLIRAEASGGGGGHTRYYLTEAGLDELYRMEQKEGAA